MTDPKTPAELADQAAEAIRALNHQLISGGLMYPADAYDTIGNLRTLADRLPQALGLIARWLGQEHDRGAIAHDSGDAGEYILAAADALGRAREDAELLAVALDGAQQAGRRPQGGRVMADELPRWRPSPDAVCARCHENPVGPGGILCPDCRAAIEAANRTERGAGADSE